MVTRYDKMTTLTICGSRFYVQSFCRLAKKKEKVILFCAFFPFFFLFGKTPITPFTRETGVF